MGRGGMQDFGELRGRVDFHLAALRLDFLELLRRRGPALGEVIVGQGEGKQQLHLPQHPYPERGRGFFRIEPDVKRRRAVLAKPAPVKKSHLKVV